MKKTIVDIEGFYKNKGYSGESLRKILEKDKEWLDIVKKRKINLIRKFTINKIEEKKYVMSTDDDYIILGKINELEKTKLAEGDKFLLKVLKSQLEYDWRKPILSVLKSLENKYKGSK